MNDRPRWQTIVATTVVTIRETPKAVRRWTAQQRRLVIAGLTLTLLCIVLVVTFDNFFWRVPAWLVAFMVVRAPLEALLTLSVLGLGATLYAAKLEHEGQMNLLAFDLMRASAATHGLWITATASAIWNPKFMLTLVGDDNGPARLTIFYFFGIAIGMFFLALFRIHANSGRHPWQQPHRRPTIEEAAVAEGSKA